MDFSLTDEQEDLPRHIIAVGERAKGQDSANDISERHRGERQQHIAYAHHKSPAARTRQIVCNQIHFTSERALDVFEINSVKCILNCS